ncbi:unnamed protein product [Calypogeia fissa]
MGVTCNHPWIDGTGCAISGSGEIQKYLGAPLGIDIHPTKLHDYCLDKISARLTSWSSKLLSFTGRTILIRHVLQAIPIYHMMFVETSKRTCDKLEKIFREFLWGHKTAGGKKLALVAWDKLTRPRAEGGLGFKNMQAHSQALLTKWVTEALDSPNTEWAQLFRANLGLMTWENGKNMRRQGYNILDRILLGKITAFGRQNYTAGLWKAWLPLRFNLSLHPQNAVLPSRWRISDVINSMPEFGNQESHVRMQITTTLARLHIKNLIDLKNLQDTDNETWERRLVRIRGIDRFILEEASLLLDTLYTTWEISGDIDQEASAWKWLDQEKDLSCFSLKNKHAYTLLSKMPADTERWNRRWNCTNSEDPWRRRWAKLWHSDLPTRGKTFLWRILAHGLYTGARAFKLGFTDVNCLCCPDRLESISHIFLECKHATASWNSLRRMHTKATGFQAFPTCITFLAVLDCCLEVKSRNSAFLFLLYATLWNLWLARNAQLHEGTSRYFSAELLTSQASDLIFAVCTRCRPGPKLAQLRKARWWIDASCP